MKINDKIDKLKLELECENDYATQGAILRTRSNYYEQGEKNSKYFFALEKRLAKSKTMNNVFDENNSLINQERQILAQQAKFYKTLYTKDSNTSFKDNYLPKPERLVSKDENERMESELTLEEVGVALKQMKNQKAPGLDGIPADLLKIFYGRIKFLLLEVFNECFKVKRIFPSGRNGVISLIPKKKRDLRWIKNWRPIILLCADYKLLAKVVSNRTKETLQRIIHPDQTAFLKGRNISDNIRKVIDTVQYADQKKLNILLISLDFEKAFDRVSYESLQKAMLFLGFKEKMVQWVKILFTDFALCTVNNGHFSSFFTPTRGLFQGNPFSCFGFIIIIELLAMLVHTNQKIEGIRMGTLHHLISLFVDDITLFIPNKTRAWAAIQETIDYFEHISGLKVNYDKSNVYRLGSARESNARFYSKNQLNWSEGPIETLGIFVTESNDDMLRLNIDPLFEKMERVLAIWKIRGLSLIGKIMVVNSLAISLFVYRMSVLPMLPEKYYQRYESLVQKFIWNDKRSKIASKVLYGNKQDGGLGLCSIRNKDLAVKVNWVLRLNRDSSLKQLASEVLKEQIGELIWQCSIKPKDAEQMFKTRGFWQDVLIAWSKFTHSELQTKEEPRNEVIWMNSNIKIENKLIYWKSWHQKGIVRLSDIVEEGQIMSLDRLNEKYQASFMFTSYCGLIKALPKA